MHSFASSNRDDWLPLAFDHEGLVFSGNDVPDLGFSRPREATKHHNNAQWYDNFSPCRHKCSSRVTELDIAKLLVLRLPYRSRALVCAALSLPFAVQSPAAPP